MDRGPVESSVPSSQPTLWAQIELLLRREEEEALPKWESFASMGREGFEPLRTEVQRILSQVEQHRVQRIPWSNINGTSHSHEELVNLCPPVLGMRESSILFSARTQKRPLTCMVGSATRDSVRFQQ